jgi:hypothetical protein
MAVTLGGRDDFSRGWFFLRTAEIALTLHTVSLASPFLVGRELTLENQLPATSGGQGVSTGETTEQARWRRLAM